MKSEKAEKYLSENGLGYPYTGYVTEQVAERAAKLAEQEVEERMRERAIEAYCDRCFVGITRECQVSKACCNDLQDFIQILDEK